jgi:tRNA pseudouridine32 synthase/23S rRNA pseudouridine746 synthase
LSFNKSAELISLFEDKHILAIHKPAGVAFHSDDSHQGIVQRVRDYFESNNLFPVHRLDKMTSGLMVFAKTKDVNSALSEMLANKTIEKYYLALSSKKPSKKQGTISGDMLKGRRGSYLLSREKSNPAVTRFMARSLGAVINEKAGLDCKWLFVLKPETGKTHQLRVALKSLTSPILGDQRYGGAEADRGYLHAFRMRFDLFGLRYDLIDPHFQGDAFDYSCVVESSDIREPQKLKWPKTSFLLPSAQ